MQNFSILLFDGFETLDALGPAEIIGELPKHYKLQYASQHGGMVTSAQGLRVETVPFSAIPNGGVLLIPGGIGTRALVTDEEFIHSLKTLAEQAVYVLAVCTGTLVLAKTGLLNGKPATSNKRLFHWALSTAPQVQWQRSARWVVSGKLYTSSGVTAGMDMTLGFLRDTLGYDTAKDIANGIEYLWNENAANDPFAL